MAEAIPFTRGVPSADMLPVDDMRRALATAMEREPTVALSYATGGHPGLRRWIGARYGAPGERVICANGSLEAFAFVAEVLLARASTKRVLVEAPTYDRSILILKRAGADVVGVPVDGDGIDTDALEAELARERPAFVYVIPNFQNPSGATMSAERRARVLALAEQHDIVVVEDDPYGLLRWAGESPATLCELDGGTRVMTLSSFTKTVAPGLRIGYVVAPEALATAIGKYAENTYISPCMVSQTGLAAYCEAGYFEPGVERAKQALEQRCDAMVESVRAHFPADAGMVVPQGGYFLWIDLGPGADTTALAARAAEAGVPFVKGADFYADGGGTTAMRLAFSAVPPDRIREGIERLGRVIAAG
jgi:2-aminoadipate transaminase